MHRHWSRFGPPAYLAAAMYLGLARPAPRRPERLDAPDDLAAFLSGFPGASSLKPMS